MKDALERAGDLLSLYEAELRRRVPPGGAGGAAPGPCGAGSAGLGAPGGGRRAFLRDSGAGRAFCFCLDEPDRHPAFRAANDRTLAAAERAGGTLVPFVRLDLVEHPLEEAVRCLDLGARGIKLHPRAQGFLLNDERLEPVFALAAERGVPILIHGGRGLPPIADNLARLVDRHPEARLIIAHGGIADLAALAGAVAGPPGGAVDTALGRAGAGRELFGRGSPPQLVYASDYPYGQQPQSLLLALRIARLAGFSEDEIRGRLGGNAARIADGGSPPPLSPPKLATRTLVQPIPFARIHTYLTMATPLLWTRQPDVIGALGLALNAAAERDGHAETHERIEELLACARDLWRMVPELEEEVERHHLGRSVFRLIHLADIEALTAHA